MNTRILSDERPEVKVTESIQVTPKLEVDTKQNQGRTDTANARRLVALHSGSIRYVAAWGKWILWDGCRWTTDNSRTIDAKAKDVADSLWKNVVAVKDDVLHEVHKQIIQFARNSSNARGLRDMVDLARSEPAIAVTLDVLDSAPWLLNVENGTVDLRAGTLQEHRQDDYLTKMAPVQFDPAAQCPQWIAFLDTVMAGDASLVAYLQRLVGVSLTGQTTEHILPVLYGTGANGKSVFLSTIRRLLGGNYAMKAARDMLLARSSNAHPTALADLFGKRFVACIETEAGSRLAESLVKELSGGDRIRARHMRQDYWEFEPTHKIWLAVNHKPVIQGTDHGIWRRIKLIPFSVTIADEDQDHELPDKLADELPGILNWAIAGCLSWQKNGLVDPSAVKAATADYRSSMDTLSEFISDRCVTGADRTVRLSAIHDALKAWSDEHDEHPITSRALAKALTERGYAKRRSSVTFFDGIAVIE